MDMSMWVFSKIIKFLIYGRICENFEEYFKTQKMDLMARNKTESRNEAA